MGERADADIGAHEHQKEQRKYCGFHAAEKGGRVGIEGGGRRHAAAHLSHSAVTFATGSRARTACVNCEKREGRASDPALDLAVVELARQTFASGTFGTEPRFGLGRGAARRLAFGRGTGNFSGLGVTGPSRNWKPSLSRPSSSLSTTTRTCPPFSGARTALRRPAAS